MLVTDKYLNRFGLKFESEADLVTLQPQEVPLHGFEAGASASVNTDIPAEDEHASSLRVIYRDANPDDAETWEIDPSLGKTFVIPQIDDNDIDTVGYVFTGLISPADLRTWYRHKVGIVELEVDEIVSPTDV